MSLLTSGHPVSGWLLLAAKQFKTALRGELFIVLSEENAMKVLLIIFVLLRQNT
jgi:hypothetical protein